jgi:hypothetical protein
VTPSMPGARRSYAEPMADNDLSRVDALVDDLLGAHDPETTDQTTFRGAQYDLGLAWVHFPDGFGGLGL